MDNNKKTRSENFVNYVLERADGDAGFAAKMRRADNPATEYQSWGLLAAFGVNLEKDNERLPFALIGAALCRSDLTKDGNCGVGAALAGSFDKEAEDKKSDGKNKTGDKPGEPRLRRLLACSSTEEACRILRPILRLIESREKKRLNYAGLLRDLLYFESPGQRRIKQRWAMDFYGARTDESPDEAEAS